MLLLLVALALSGRGRGGGGRRNRAAAGARVTRNLGLRGAGGRVESHAHRLEHVDELGRDGLAGGLRLLRGLERGGDLRRDGAGRRRAGRRAGRRGRGEVGLRKRKTEEFGAELEAFLCVVSFVGGV